MTAEQAAALALGVRLRGYAFDRYKTKRKEDEDKPRALKVVIGVADVARARAAWTCKGGLADAVVLARDLINEPANVLVSDRVRPPGRRAQAARRRASRCSTSRR